MVKFDGTLRALHQNKFGIFSRKITDLKVTWLKFSRYTDASGLEAEDFAKTHNLTLLGKKPPVF